MTEITIQNDQFFLDGAPTYAGRTWKGHRIEGLLLNTRMVQATFDDENLETRQRWAYPDTGLFDAERNVTEFLAALPTYRDHGVLAVTVNFQGGSPEGYSKEQPWSNTAFTAEGEFKPAYLDRMRRVLDRLDEYAMSHARALTVPLLRQMLAEMPLQPDLEIQRGLELDA